MQAIRSVILRVNKLNSRRMRMMCYLRAVEGAGVALAWQEAPEGEEVAGAWAPGGHRAGSRPEALERRKIQKVKQLFQKIRLHIWKRA